MTKTVLSIFLLIGLYILMGAQSLPSLYIGAEIVGLSSYAINGFSQIHVFYGLISSSFLLFGLSLLFGITGSLSLRSIQATLSSGFTDPGILYFITICLLIGFSTKMVLVPFHTWISESYEKTSYGTSAISTSILPIAGWVLFIKFFFLVFSKTTGTHPWETLPNFHWPLVLTVFSILTMTWSNLCAWQCFRSKNFKQCFIYFTLTHGAWILSGLTYLSREGVVASLAYLIIYIMMNAGVFIILHRIDSVKGLVWKSPLMAITLSIIIASHMGLPPLAGFSAKLNLLSMGLEHHQTIYAAFLCLNYVFSAIIFFGILQEIFFFRPQSLSPLKISLAFKAIMILLCLVLTTLGLKWQTFVHELAHVLQTWTPL